MTAETAKCPVHFVGAGPGDPELITVKGKRLLEKADVVVYTGSLVPMALLKGLKAEIYNSAGLNLEEVMAIVYRARQEEKRVVRLHTGDPSIYGAINEQIWRLAERRIPFRIVPGVSSGNAVAAVLSTELTLPEVSQTVIITRRSSRTPVPDREKLVSLANHQATMLIFLSAGMIDNVAAELREGGYPPETPAAVVEKASWPEERVVRGTLITIAGQVEEKGITKTAVIAVGEVLAQAPPPVLSRLYDREFGHGYRGASDERWEIRGR